jgi:hypothetical protein
MARYIHTQEDWPRFRWNRESLSGRLASVRHEQGRLLGRMEALGFKLRQEAVLRTLTENVLKSSEIEGEKLDAEQVRSSIARRLGMDIGGLKGSRIYGSSLSIPSRMATVVLRELLPTWRSRDPNKVRNGSTACRPRSGKSVRTTTTF